MANTCIASCGAAGQTCGTLNATFTCSQLSLLGCSCSGCCAAAFDASSCSTMLCIASPVWLGIGIACGFLVSAIFVLIIFACRRRRRVASARRVRPANSSIPLPAFTQRSLTESERVRYGATPLQPNGTSPNNSCANPPPSFVRGPPASRKSITKAKSQKSVLKQRKSEHHARLAQQQAKANNSNHADDVRASLGDDSAPVIYEWRYSGTTARGSGMRAEDMEYDGMDDDTLGETYGCSPATLAKARRDVRRGSQRMSAIVGRRSALGSRLSLLPGFSSSESKHELQAKLGLGDLPFSDYERLQSLGQGTYGTAWLLRSPTTGVLVVGKEVPVDGQGSSGRTLAATVENEVRILSALHHPNIVAYYGAFRPSHGRLTIVMEYCDGGSLGEALDDCVELGFHLSRLTALRWARQLVEALAHLHHKRVLHRDLKTTNVFLSGPDPSRLAKKHDGLQGGWQEMRTVKLGDFGVSRALSNRTVLAETVCGTPYYMAPELMCGEPYETSADIWALGVILFEMITLVRPFAADNMGALVVMIMQGNYDEEALEASPHDPVLLEYASPSGLLARDITARPAANQLIQRLRDAEAREVIVVKQAAKEAVARGGAGVAPDMSPPSTEASPSPNVIDDSGTVNRGGEGVGVEVIFSNYK